jgi:hypothetical protein
MDLVEQAAAVVADPQTAVDEARRVLTQCREELRQAQQAEETARTAYQHSEQQRLAGVTNGAASEDALRATTAARIRVEMLMDLAAKLTADLAQAEAEWQQVEARNVRENNRLRFNELVLDHQRQAQRLDKSVRELTNALDRLRQICIEQGSLGAELGLATPWHHVYQRALLNWLGAHLSDVTRTLPEPRAQWRDQLLVTKPWDPSINPYCQPIDVPEEAA